MLQVFPGPVELAEDSKRFPQVRLQTGRIRPERHRLREQRRRLVHAPLLKNQDAESLEDAEEFGCSPSISR